MIMASFDPRRVVREVVLVEVKLAADEVNACKSIEMPSERKAFAPYKSGSLIHVPKASPRSAPDKSPKQPL